jgi:adenosyl cobinamide kinase/adenosyl cobinamide phosphate guanylyltransferase
LDANQRAIVSEMQESFRRLLDKQDKELDGLLKELKKAPKEKKVDCLTTIVTRLIEQRKEMHQEMDAMRSRMRELKSLSQSSNLPNAFEPPAALPANASSSSSSAQPNQDSQDNETAH